MQFIHLNQNIVLMQFIYLSKAFLMQISIFSEYSLKKINYKLEVIKQNTFINSFNVQDFIII